MVCGTPTSENMGAYDWFFKVGSLQYPTAFPAADLGRGLQTKPFEIFEGMILSLLYRSLVRPQSVMKLILNRLRNFNHHLRYNLSWFLIKYLAGYCVNMAVELQDCEKW